MRLRESSNFCYSMYLKLKLQATKVTSIYTLDKSKIELMILRMLQHHYEPTLPLTPPTTSHHRRHRQGPLQTNWRSCHRHRRPPSPSLSPTAAIVTILGLVVAWCCLPPPSSSSVARSPPPPRCHCALSALLIAHGAILDRHAALTPSGTTRRVPLPSAPPFLKDRTIAPAPPSRPPRCLGLLSGGWR